MNCEAYSLSKGNIFPFHSVVLLLVNVHSQNFVGIIPPLMRVVLGEFSYKNMNMF